MTPLLWVLFGGGVAVGACAVLVGAYRRRPADPERTPAALMLDQVRSEVAKEEATDDGSKTPPGAR